MHDSCFSFLYVQLHLLLTGALGDAGQNYKNLFALLDPIIKQMRGAHANTTDTDTGTGATMTTAAAPTALHGCGIVQVTPPLVPRKPLPPLTMCPTPHFRGCANAGRQCKCPGGRLCSPIPGEHGSICQ
jgi:hypothetical protein